MRVDHTCCQCGAVGAVDNKYMPPASYGTRERVPIHWVCIVCSRRVCINCALTVPGSVPVELTEDTLCSDACRHLAGQG